MQKYIIIIFLSVVSLTSRAQFKIDRLIENGEIALHYEDYVLSIQYFNQAISTKPYLYQPWWYRGAAKYSLEDFTGAEADATEAIKLNPYVHEIYDLRALARVGQNKYKKAIIDYNSAIKLSPTNQNYWFNRAICQMNVKAYKDAHLEIDTIVKRWSKFANAYSLNAEIYLQEKDTIKAAAWLDKSLDIDPYNAGAWATRAGISLARKQWKDADNFLSKAIHIKPKTPSFYINRALARLNYNNLRGMMSDYDTALDLDPNNFLAHYNRGLMRMQLGDDNRAITDFDYVIKMEPSNFLAIFNRAILKDRTGDLRGAINDYSTVIRQFPNFWVGLQYRARAYRRLGMTAKAELDEFKIFKAQIDKRNGIQRRWSKQEVNAVRKRSEVNPDKYNQIVVDDSSTAQEDYKSPYRGRVQDHSVQIAFMPMYMLSYFQYANGINTYQVIDREVETLNNKQTPQHYIYITCNPTQQSTETQTKDFFVSIDTLTTKITAANNINSTKDLLLFRAITYDMVQNYDAAINDLTTYLQIDSTSYITYWQRGVSQFMMNNFNALTGVDTNLMMARVTADFNRAIALAPQNAYLYFNRANVYAAQKDYVTAIDNFTVAINLDSHLAEAYYNRGLARIYSNNNAEGLQDLSKAGELGLYNAYSVMKHFMGDNK